MADTSFCNSINVTDTCIIIVNWNSFDDTIECLESLLKSTEQNFKIIIIDNASSDNSPKHLEEWFSTIPQSYWEALQIEEQKDRWQVLSYADNVPLSSSPSKITLLASDRNGGFAYGNNVGLRFALNTYKACPFFWLLNPDTTVLETTLEKLLARMKANDQPGMCGTELRFYHNPNTYQAVNGSSFNYLTGTSRPILFGAAIDTKINTQEVEEATTFVTGASLCVSRDFVEAVGLMNEEYFLYYEEIDWAVRNKGRFKIGYAENSVVYHKEGGSIGSSSKKGSRSLTSEYYLAKGKIKFAKNHLRAYNLLLYFMYSCAQIVVRLARFQPKHAWAIFSGTLKGTFS